MEAYKSIETLYYLPWVLKLKKSLQHSGPANQLSQILRENLRWRDKEAFSIVALFELLDETILRCSNLGNSVAFKDINLETASPESIAKRIYKIRNILVHQQDYYDLEPLIISDKCWPILFDYLIDISHEFYSKHKLDAAFEYALSSDIQRNSMTSVSQVVVAPPLGVVPINDGDA